MNTIRDRFKLIPAVYILLLRDDEILLLRRANTGYQDGTYSLPSGHLDGNELATTGAVRETKEETGVVIDPQNIKLVHTSHRLRRGEVGQERIDLFFEVREWQGEVVNAEPAKCDDLSWFPLNKLPKNMLPFVKSVIDDVASGVHYSEHVEEIYKPAA